MHACGLAELLDSDRVIFPVNASVLSAFGTLVTPVRIDLARSLVRRLDGIDESERDAVLDELRTEGRRVLAAAGVPEEAVRFRYGVDARYAGQGNEITVWVGEGEAWPATAAFVAERFDEEYERIYGLTIPDVGVEAVTWRLSAYAAEEPVQPVPDLAPTRRRGRPRPPAGPLHPLRRRRRTSRSTAATRSGPGPASTGRPSSRSGRRPRVIRPGWSVEVGADGSLVATRGRIAP